MQLYWQDMQVQRIIVSQNTGPGFRAYGRCGSGFRWWSGSSFSFTNLHCDIAGISTNWSQTKTIPPPPLPQNPALASAVGRNKSPSLFMSTVCTRTAGRPGAVPPHAWLWDCLGARQRPCWYSHSGTDIHTVYHAIYISVDTGIEPKPDPKMFRGRGGGAVFFGGAQAYRIRT